MARMSWRKICWTPKALCEQPPYLLVDVSKVYSTVVILVVLPRYASYKHY